MRKVAIVTDSTCDLPPEIIEKYQIHVIPILFIWDEVGYKDSIDMTQDAFYAKAANSSTLPTTSKLSPAEFLEIYHPLEEQGLDILTITISSKLSGTVESARQASREVTKTRAEVLDSYSVSMGLGYPVLAAAMAADAGKNLDECLEAATQTMQNTIVTFVISTLEYVKRGGRIGGATALLGSALQIKPILGIIGGQVETLQKTRTFNKALKELMRIMEEQVDKAIGLYISVLHIQAEEKAKEVAAEFRAQIGESRIKDFMIRPATPIIGIHSGPGTVGIVISQLPQT